MSPCLPDELCLEIASEVSGSRALRALSLTSRQFHRVTQPLLYEDIVINAFPTFSPVVQLHATLMRTPSLAGFVKSFTIDLTNHQLFVLDYCSIMILDEILVRLPCLSAFSILKCERLSSMMELKFFTRPRPSVALKTIRLPLFINNTDGFSEFLRCQPALEHLEFLGTLNGPPRVDCGDLPCLRVLEGPFNALPLLRPSVTHVKLFVGLDYMSSPTIFNPPPATIGGVKVLHVTAPDIFQAMAFSMPFVNVESLTWELPAMYDLLAHIPSLFPKLRYLRLVSSGPWFETMAPLPRQISSPSLECLEFHQGPVAHRWYYPSIDYTPICMRWTCRDGEEWLHDWNSGAERLT